MISSSDCPASLRPFEPLAPYTSLKVGGCADYYASIETPTEAAAVMRWAASRGLPWKWLGGGSNVLVADAGIEGLAARYVGSEVELPRSHDGSVVSGAGRSFLALARMVARNGWSGLEWAANVPGTVGGAIVNNAGAFGSCVAECLVWSEIVTDEGNVQRLAVADFGYAYRNSRLKRGELGEVLVTRAAFHVSAAPPEEIMARVRTYQEQRNASQPRQLSAGSVFANPSGDFSGRLIERVGLKGMRIGGVEISRQHANFIVNLGRATAEDVYQLMRLAQDAVWREEGVWLRPELELVGRWPDAQRAALREPVR